MKKKNKNNQNPLNPYKKRLGDRKDGRRIRTTEPLTIVEPFFMKTRNDANNLIQDYIDLSYINSYIREKKSAGLKNFNAMHVLISTYVRTVSQKPGINRFVSGYRLFARNSIDVIMEVKKELALNAPATMVKFHFAPDSTAEEVYHEMNNKIEAYWNEETKENAFDKVARLLKYIPRWIFSLLRKIFDILDYFGKLPKFLLEVSPFHGSMVITSMASLGIPSIFHHLYNFGNIPMFISFSTARHTYEMNKDGKVEQKHYLDINFTTDDRICDGQYYASALHQMRVLLKNPKLLDKKPEAIIPDIR